MHGHLLKQWSAFYDGRIWASVQMLHVAWVRYQSDLPLVRLADLAQSYLRDHWPLVLLLAMLYVPRLSGPRRAWRERAASGGRSVDLHGMGQRIEHLLSGTVILDSNIWMNPALDFFFQRLERALDREHRVLTLFGPQFDEMCNIKDRASYASKRGRLARLALARIERLQRCGCLRIDPLVLQADPRAYADPLILTLIAKLTADGQRVHFVSDDRELRIRARQIADARRGAIAVCTSGCLLGTAGRGEILKSV